MSFWPKRSKSTPRKTGSARRRPRRPVPEGSTRLLDLKEPGFVPGFFCGHSAARALRRAAHRLAAVRRRDRRAVGCIFVELVAQRANGDAEDVGGVRAVAEAVLERLQDEVALDLGDGAADEVARDLLGREGGIGGDVVAAHFP